MGRLTVFILALAGCLSVTTANDFDCSRVTDTRMFPKEVCFISDCTRAMKEHIQHEFNAAFKYMYMGAHFAQDYINRPGLAKFLFEAASEERGHAIQMLDYLNLRGIKLNSTLNYQFPAAIMLNMPLTYLGALEEAVNMEIEVTNLIYYVVEKCNDDFHGADVFTNPILDEQHDGLRKLQGAVRGFKDLQSGQSGQGIKLAEYMFDHKMMHGDF